jgi:hypothetical protein
MHHHAVVWALASVLVLSGCSANRCATQRTPPAPATTAVQATPMTLPAGSAAAPATSSTPAAPASATATTNPTTTSDGGTAAPTGSARSDFAALGEPNADTHATRGLSGGSPRTAMAPNMAAIPSPPSALSVPANAGVDQSLKAIPAAIPLGHLSREVLEGPLRDPLRLARCHKTSGTKVEIDVVIYNGTALGVTVRTTPSDRVLNFCIERIVRDTSWIKELAVNRVTVTL